MNKICVYTCITGNYDQLHIPAVIDNNIEYDYKCNYKEKDNAGNPIVDANGNEMLLPKSEQIPTDFYRKGDTVKAVVIRVDNKNNKLIYKREKNYKQFLHLKIKYKILACITLFFFNNFIN